MMILRKIKDKIIIQKRERVEHKKWWDGEYKKKKKEVERILREWRSGKMDKEKYLKEKGNIESCAK